MTTYGPWVQPDDAWALSDSWLQGTLDADGQTADRTDPVDFQASVDDVIAGTNVLFDLPLVEDDTSYSPSSQATHIDSGFPNALARGRVSAFAPRLDQLFFGPVVPGEWPTTAVDVELEDPEGVPQPGTIKVYGYVMHYSSDAAGSTKRGSVVRRLVPGDYTEVGGYPETTWTQAVTPTGAILATFAQPSFEESYEAEPFEITDLTPDANGRIVFSVVSDPLHSTWTYEETHAVQLLQTPLVSPPSTGALPIFGQFYTPPRYRWVYERDPPLRQFPRGDNLVGTGGSRQRGAGSRQASNRQGWNGTYL